MARILVVDDEEAIRVYLTLLLGDRGHDVTAVADADEALETLATRAYDLVCLDIMMPRRSGIWLYAAIRKLDRARDIPAVFISGFSQVNDLRDEQYFRRTVRDENIPMPDACLEKPVDPGVLLDVVDRLTRGRVAAEGAGVDAGGERR